MRTQREPITAAYFDIDGTLVQGTVLHQYVWLLRHILPPVPRLRRYAALAARTPYYWCLDRLGRDRFLRAFYRNYAGFALDELTHRREALFQEFLRPRLFPQARRTVLEHRRAGRRVVLLTGSLGYLMEPLARYLQADDLIAQDLVRSGPYLTGKLDGPPLNGEERAARLREDAARHGIDLAGSYACGDSIGDLPMLTSVGHPVAVNPCLSLRREASQRGWRCLDWSLHDRQLDFG